MLFEEALDPAIIPMSEPQRQYYFIEEAQSILAEKEKAAGRKLTFCVQTFGCQMNAHDSEKLTGILTQIGYIPTDSEDADFVIYNTCTVRENANLKVYGRLGYLKGKKEKNPNMMIALCGCMMQEPEVVAKLKKSYRFIDLIFGTHNLYRFAELYVQAARSEKMTVDVVESDMTIVEELPSIRKYAFKSGVNIMFGCNNFCSYCIVPYVRGRERSRKPEDILAEVEKLAASGVKEIMLLGQNVNSYGKNLEYPMSFAELLSKVANVNGIERVRFMTSHPKDLSQELIDVMAANDKICRHFHLPLQSGSSALLQDMNRHYTKEQYLDLVERLRKAMPDIAITTDIIVGYPGETEEDFEETMDVVRKVEYDSAFTFIYSKRTGTPAAKRDDQVPEDVVKERFDRLLALVQELAQKKAMQIEGQVQPVLVEQINEQDDSLVTGRLSNNSVVHFPGTADLIGTIVNVELTQCKGFYYLGNVVK